MVHILIRMMRYLFREAVPHTRLPIFDQLSSAQNRIVFRKTQHTTRPPQNLFNSLFFINFGGTIYAGSLQAISQCMHLSIALQARPDHRAPLRLEYHSSQSEVFPYIQVGAGIVHNDIHQDKIQGLVGQAIEFTPQGSIGLGYMLNKPDRCKSRACCRSKAPRVKLV